MATRKRKSPTLKQRIKLVKSGKLEKLLPGGGAIKRIGSVLKRGPKKAALARASFKSSEARLKAKKGFGAKVDKQDKINALRKQQNRLAKDIADGRISKPRALDQMRIINNKLEKFGALKKAK